LDLKGKEKEKEELLSKSIKELLDVEEE